MSVLFEPPDVDEQHELWSANCGPTALAALLGRSVADVRPLVETVQGGRFLGYMHAGHLLSALKYEGLRPSRREVIRKQREWPQGRGLVVIQIDGPWCNEGVNQKAAYRYTHTVASAFAGKVIYDGNAARWCSREWWEENVMTMLVQDERRATGWYTRTILEVA